MNLEITNCNNFFKVKGTLNKGNVALFKYELKDVFEKRDQVTISIKDITGMDKYGVHAMAQLHEEALSKNKKLSIIGYGCKDLYDHFKSGNAA
ncbi:STAS domain-containing protein [Algibacter mikhailovii]|uniref:STAS domain-containing protein n=1 Tax=Algibacter mikhailovii TaxID=425498 RepID=A0A918R6X9_9FLAO|nr:STAS domain-containing protein [Algibacter mikhailovii]GGZ85984.1 hypothetical protein GCM10007028_25360 [Algibacter mikhailovii]